MAELKCADTVAGDQFGNSVGISGTTAIVGAPQHANGGEACAFTEWLGNANLKGSDTVAGDSFGSVAISGTTAIVGAPYAGDVPGVGAAGRAYVFAGTAGAWKQVAELRPADTNRSDEMGGAVAISGTTAIVGAPDAGDSIGRAYVFAKTAGVWKQVAELRPSDSTANDDFGVSVGISGTTAIVVSYHAAYVFTETKGVWTQVSEWKNVGGQAVAISGPTAIVGAPSEESEGRAFLFTETAGSWKQVAELKGSDTVVNDYFGLSVAISGTTAIVGAPNHAIGGRGYVFTDTKGVWTQVAELKGADTVAKDEFGSSVGISGTTAIVGAPRHDDLAGRAYVFTV